MTKLSIILYHKQTDLSIGFAKIFPKGCEQPSLHFGTRANLIYPSRICILFLLLHLCRQVV